MKKKIGTLFVSVLLLAVCSGASAVLRNDAMYFGESNKLSARTLSKEAAPDEAYLNYYGLGDFKTHLPVLYLDTKGQQIEKENKIWADLGILEPAKEGKRNVTEQPDQMETITIKMRGASSYSGFDKKQYRIKCYKKQGSGKAKEIEFLGMKAHSEWVLNGPYLDKTLIRNRLLYNLAGEIFEWAPDTRFCEIFLDGRYQGVYVATEPVTNGVSRLNLTEFGLLSGETSYIVKRDRVGTEDVPLKTYGKTEGKTTGDLYVSYPSAVNLTKAQKKWIEQDISRFEYALYSDDFEKKRSYAEYIDVDNFVDYFIFNEFTMNYDAGNLSTYLYKDLSDRMKLAVWDYNNAFDNYQWSTTEADQWWTIDNCWFDRLIQDRKLIDRVQERYQELRRDVLSDEHIDAMIKQYKNELGNAVERNFAVWGYTFSVSLYLDSSRELASYDAAMEQMISTIRARLDFMDRHIEDLYEYCIN